MRSRPVRQHLRLTVALSWLNALILITVSLICLRAVRAGIISVTMILVATSVLAVLAGFWIVSRMSRSVTISLVQLDQVAQRHRHGDMDARADTSGGPSEVRDLAVTFNVLAAHNARLAAAQAETHQLQQLTFDIGRTIRATSGVQEAMDITCQELGPPLAARRVIVTTVSESQTIGAAAQWHAPGLDDLARVPHDIVPYLGQLSSELWSSGNRLVIEDLLAEDVQQQVWPQLLHRDTGATALILVPIGLGERAIGNLNVIGDTGPRRWKPAEVATVQQVANFLARAISQAEYEEQRDDYVSRLENLDRQKTEFLSTVSHELRTPLTSIQGYLELLLEGEVGPMSSGQRHMLGVIERNTSRLRGLIEDILALNKIEAGGLLPGNREVSVRELVGQTVEELRPLADKKAVRLCVDVGHDPATITGDQTQLQRALVNILFTRFFRASNAASQAIPGTGLGLAIVQAIVEIHHGRLALDSVEGKSTTISLRFPHAGPA